MSVDQEPGFIRLELRGRFTERTIIVQSDPPVLRALCYRRGCYPVERAHSLGSWETETVFALARKLKERMGVPAYRYGEEKKRIPNQKKDHLDMPGLVLDFYQGAGRMMPNEYFELRREIFTLYDGLPVKS